MIISGRSSRRDQDIFNLLMVAYPNEQFDLSPKKKLVQSHHFIKHFSRQVEPCMVASKARSI